MSQRDPDCIFCKILADELPSTRLYEDEHCIAFLDLFPLAPGHSLLIPRDHHELLVDMPDETMAALGRVLPRLARAVKAATGAEGFNVFQTNGKVSGQEVPHVHFHVIPRDAGDGLGFRWKAGAYAEGEMAAWQAKILEVLES